MYGAFARAALGVPIAVLVGAIIQFIVPYLLPYQGPETSFLYRLFDALAENAILLMLAALAAAVLARSVVESNAGA